MTRDDLKQAIFGGGDGLCSALGAIVMLAAQGQYTALVTAAVAFAVGSAWSMGGTEFLADPAESLRRAAVMAGATLVGSLAPALPFFVLGGRAAWAGSAAVTLALASLIAYVRPHGVLRSCVQTFGIVGVGVALAVGASLVVGSLS